MKLDHPVRTVVLAIALSLVTFLAAAGLHWTRGSHEPLRLRSWQWILELRQNHDSLLPMERAYELLSSGTSQDMYRDVVDLHQFRFQYSPAALLPLEIHARATETFGLKWTLEKVFKACSLLALAAVIVLVTLMARRTGGSLATAERNKLMIGAAILAAGFGPTLYAFPLGQIQLMLDAGVVLLVCLWAGNHRLASGVVAGILAIFKPQFAVLLLWGLACREFRFCGGMLLGSVPPVLWSLARFGIDPYFDYLRFLKWLGSSGHAYYPNQSINGFLNRLMQTEPWWQFNPVDQAPVNTVVALGTTITSALLIGGLLVYAYRLRRRPGQIELAIALLTLTLASPIAWEHHYGFLPVVFILLLPFLSTPWQRCAWVFCYVLTVDIYYVSQWTNPLNNMVISSIFFGAALLLGMLYWHSMRDLAVSRGTASNLDAQSVCDEKTLQSA